MTFLLFAATALVAYRLWTRVNEAETALEKLTARIALLERTDVAPLPRAFEPTRAPEPVAPLETIAAAAVPPAVAASREDAVFPPPPTAAPEALESRIGSRWLLYIGIVAIVVGVSYFEKLAIDNHWVNETWRVIQGGMAGLLLAGGGLRIARKGYRLYGQLLAGAGIAILYLSTYAAFNFYQLIGHTTAFTLMSAITIGCAWLANVERSQGLAVVAVTGGFATPFLLPTDIDSEVALFGYDTILIAGTIVMARRRDWPALNSVSYVFTALTVLLWAARFYASTKYLTTELFLTLFCAMFLYALNGTYRSARLYAALQRLILWTAPFGYHVLSLANLFDHSSALLIYLLIVALVGGVAGSRTNAWIRLSFWFAVAAPLLAWTSVHAGEPTALMPGYAAWIGLFVLNLIGLFGVLPNAIATFGEADIALLHLNGLATYVGLYLLPGRGHTGQAALIAAGFAALNFACGYTVRTRSRTEALHFTALASTFVMIVMALELSGPWITIGWATEGTLVTWLGLHERRAWLRAAGLVLFAAAVGRLVGAPPPTTADAQLFLVNTRGLSGLYLVVLIYVLAYLYRHYQASIDAAASFVATFVIGASVLTLWLLTSEINLFWRVYDRRASTSTSLRFMREMTLSLTWAAYATVLVIVGLMKKYAPVRYFAMIVFAMTIVKVFAVDLSELDRIYRVLSIIGLGITLLVTSYLYQKLNADHPPT